MAIFKVCLRMLQWRIPLGNSEKFVIRAKLVAAVVGCAIAVPIDTANVKVAAV
ncbi:MAG: hypothetical protein SWZ49_11305 [Cyanobacteriota bacterium]|nr:hypothetical protein [Cyanobacteriota bacterium]